MTSKRAPAGQSGQQQIAFVSATLHSPASRLPPPLPPARSLPVLCLPFCATIASAIPGLLRVSFHDSMCFSLQLLLFLFLVQGFLGRW